MEFRSDPDPALTNLCLNKSLSESQHQGLSRNPILKLTRANIFSDPDHIVKYLSHNRTQSPAKSCLDGTGTGDVPFCAACQMHTLGNEDKFSVRVLSQILPAELRHQRGRLGSHRPWCFNRCPCSKASKAAPEHEPAADVPGRGVVMMSGSWHKSKNTARVPTEQSAVGEKHSRVHRGQGKQQPILPLCSTRRQHSRLIRADR